MVAFREPNGGDTRWPQEIHVVADIREPIYAAVVAACGADICVGAVASRPLAAHAIV